MRYFASSLWLAAFGLASEALLTLPKDGRCQSPETTIPIPTSSEEELPSELQRDGIVSELLSKANQFGRADRGLHVFANAKAACSSCHKIGDNGGIIGPELLATLRERTPKQIAESLLWPSLSMAPEYTPFQFLLDDDSTVTGYLTQKTSDAENADASNTDPGTISVRNPANGEVIELDTTGIVARKAGRSLMPSGLLESLPQQHQWDLLQFLIELPKSSPERLAAIAQAVRNGSHHGILTFTYDNKPLNSATRPLHTEYVNRDRVYDFYGKQANAFRKVDTGLELLQAAKPLDDGKYGHWGNQDEETWKGTEWADMKLNSIHCTVFAHDKLVVARGVCFQIGKDQKDNSQEYSACYDPDQKRIVAVWKGGFLQFSPVRHGLMASARMVGEQVDAREDLYAPLMLTGVDSSSIKRRYLGYRQIGDTVEFLYEFGDRTHFHRFGVVDGKFISDQGVFNESRHASQLSKLRETGQRWPEIVETPIRLSAGEGLVVDTIELPTENPWNAPVFCSAHGFLQDGTAIVTTIHGDVFRVSGVSFNDDQAHSPAKARWKKIASGLHHPLGVWIDQDEIFVQCRNQLTRLVDLDGDTETDYYECVNNAFTTSPNGHDYICGLVRDSQGNFYTVSGNEGVLQLSPDGKTSIVIATGFRNPDGLGILPGGILTVPTSEGDWTPASMIHRFSITDSRTSATPFHFGYRGPRDGLPVKKPFLALPRLIDNSCGGQYWVTDARMGPLQNQIVHTSFGTGTALLVLQDPMATGGQGAAVVLPGDYQSGIHRAATNPADGLLYFTGMTGWGTYTPKPGCFERLRYTGAPVCLPIKFHVCLNGIELRFSEPVDPTFAKQVDNHFAQAWNYRYSPAYGSPEYSVSQPGTIGHDRLRIESVVLDDDNRGVFLEIPELQRCSQLHLNLILNDGDPIEIFATVNELDMPRVGVPSFSTSFSKKFSPHPLEQDLEVLSNPNVNPWRNANEGSRPVRVEAADNLQFAQKRLTAKGGEWIALTFANPDVVPHNWALIRPGSLERVGDQVNKLIGDPDAYRYQYVPKTEDVICYTDIVDPKSEFTITFQVPDQPGIYPYLCTFPGHWMVMNGELVVE